MNRQPEAAPAVAQVPEGWKLVASDGHIFNGLCPENPGDPSRDPECPECRAMLAAVPEAPPQAASAEDGKVYKDIADRYFRDTQAAPSAGEVEREALIERGRKLADTLESWYGPHGHALTVRQLVAALSHKGSKP